MGAYRNSSDGRWPLLDFDSNAHCKQHNRCKVVYPACSNRSAPYSADDRRRVFHRSVGFVERRNSKSRLRMDRVRVHGRDVSDDGARARL